MVFRLLPFFRRSHPNLFFYTEIGEGRRTLTKHHFLSNYIPSLKTYLFNISREHPVGRDIGDGCSSTNFDRCLCLEQHGSHMGACLPTSRHTVAVGCQDLPILVGYHPGIQWLFTQPLRVINLHTQKTDEILQKKDVTEVSVLAHTRLAHGPHYSTL